MHFLRKGDIKNRKKVLIVGASGSIGSTAVHLAKDFSIISGSPTPSLDDLVFFKELVESGKYKPVIDRSYPLEQIVNWFLYI